ncbi:hypothetical protein DPMN_085005 [Dreissena polymorpha]|uniref:Uncharacterized protein n=1 Tax=Dreissena polymorpha TaxID=45954 RepID=A0A9D3YBU7_DREPO|nr:hypothetical protein DPMN_085005 [Dreissena polymorpha]
MTAGFLGRVGKVFQLFEHGHVAGEHTYLLGDSGYSFKVTPSGKRTSGGYFVISANEVYLGKVAKDEKKKQVILEKKRKSRTRTKATRKSLISANPLYAHAEKEVRGDSSPR